MKTIGNQENFIRSILNSFYEKLQIYRWSYVYVYVASMAPCCSFVPVDKNISLNYIRLYIFLIFIYIFSIENSN